MSYTEIDAQEWADAARHDARPDRDHDGCYVKDALLAVRSTRVIPPEVDPA